MIADRLPDSVLAGLRKVGPVGLPGLPGLVSDADLAGYRVGRAKMLAPVLEVVPQDRKAAIIASVLAARSRTEVDVIMRSTLDAYGSVAKDYLQREIYRVSGHRAKADVLERKIKALEEFADWLGVLLAPNLGPVRESAFHKATAQTVIPATDDADGPLELVDEMHALGCEVFLVEHDWAALLADADTDDGDFRLPYDRMCFEFTLSGRRVCLLVKSQDGEPAAWEPLAQTTVGWISGETTLTTLLRPQVRAIAISLDAEVVTAEVIRAPSALNVARVKRGHQPLYDHHILTIKRTPRYEPTGNAPTGHRKRLHFRRGHWRHYPSHKTWIRWCLVGDPSLGFADKDYRL